MTASAIATKSTWKVFRCPSCGTKGEFPADYTPHDASQLCDVCRFHRGHELVYDFRCAICVARLWQSWLRALRILLFQSEALHSEDL